MLKIGILGCGKIAQVRHIPEYADNPNCELVGFFNPDPQVIYYGSRFLRLIAPLVLFFAIYQPLAAAMRGAGNARAPMYAMLFSGVLFRQTYLFTVSKLFPGNDLLVGAAYPIGWALCSMILIYIYRHSDIASHRIVED